MVTDTKARVSKELHSLIQQIRVDYILRNKKPPSSASITKAIIKKYKVCKEELLYDKSIKL